MAEQKGFLLVTAIMVALAVVSLLVALWRKWI